ncbi:unnamed protein product [Parnassius apollo]|uniref:Carboxylic ester hydrolase n=1 Tax=Parnassius apollo TaxID=110799 RepID=A0A8S3WL90_PARAO|nr:unnamed protein product [Parnassius apollo]
MKYEKKLVLFTWIVMNIVDQPAPEVTIEQGVLRGKISGNGMFFEYVGIPYASTNSSLRFKAPGPAPSWDGIYEAIDEIYFCPQVTPIGVLGSEDCLKINVYVPAVAERPLPVMVYIHGGVFILGSGGKLIYGPDFLIQKGVIVVTFNYRLGVLGFLCLGIKEAPGNMGLKDQVAALRWVKKNIAAFGGDPENITLFGESAGATSVSLLLASDVTAGLFSRAIIQSGTSLSNWVINRKPIEVASLLAKSLGYNTKDPLEIYNIFSKMDFKELVLAKTSKPLTKYFESELIHLPCVEEEIPGEESVIKNLPYNLLANKSKVVPVIYGTNSNEGLFLLYNDTEETLEQRNKRYLFASDLHFKTEEEAEMEAQKIHEFYFGKDKISLNKAKNISDLYTHLYFETPSLFETELLIQNANATIYNYYFNYSGARSLMKIKTGFFGENGACHGDDIFYLFKLQFLPFTFFKRDENMINVMTSLWTNFAKYGDPTPDPTELNVKWLPSNKQTMNFLYIDEHLKMGPIPNPESYRLWKFLYKNYRKREL